MSSPKKITPRYGAADVAAGMTLAYSAGVADLRDVENNYGTSLRGMFEPLLPLYAELDIEIIRNKLGEPVGAQFLRVPADGSAPFPVTIRYDEEGCRALRDTTILLHPSGKGAGENARSAPEEQLVQHARRGLLDRTDMLVEQGVLPKDADHPARKKWRGGVALAAANRIAKSLKNTIKHWTIDRHPSRLGAYAVVQRQRPIMRGTAASLTMGGAENAQRLSQTIAQRPVMLLMPGKLPATMGLRRKLAFKLVGLEGVDDKLVEDGVAAIFYVAGVRGRDMDPKVLRKLLPVEVAEQVSKTGAKQRLVFTALARVWLGTEDEDRVRELGLWLCREVNKLKRASDISKEELADVIDFASVPVDRVEELQRLFLGDNARLAELQPFNSEMTLDEALAACDAVRAAAAEEQALLEARALEARVETERLALEARIARMSEPFTVAPPFPTGTTRLARSRLRLVHLPTEAALSAEGARMHNCLGTKGAHARAGRLQFYGVVRRLTKAERAMPRVELDGCKAAVCDHPELGSVLVLASVSLAAVSPDELRVVELRGRGNSAPPAVVVNALRAAFPRR